MDKFDQLKSKPVCIFTRVIPQEGGSGAEMRVYTNLRAYVDLGFDVEVIYVCIDDHNSQPMKPLPFNVRWTQIKSKKKAPPLSKRISYYLGWPFDWILDLDFEWRQLVRAEICKRENKTPGAIYQMEYLHLASAAIDYPGINSIYSMHDISSRLVDEVTKIREQMGAEPRNYSRRLRMRYLDRAERMTVKQSRLVLTIAKHETDITRDEWGCSHAEFFPMSWPNEARVHRNRQWMEDGRLRLLHLGRIDSLPSFRSLEFIFGKVFPNLPADVLNRVEMLVVGTINNTKHANTILEMARPYPQVRFLGFKDDILPFYASGDLQIVGSTAATGLRTRIIESFVYGIPVLSTKPGAEGVYGLEPGKNIMLADDVRNFCECLVSIVKSPDRLPRLAEAGRQTYESYYSRPVAAQRLNELLVRYIS
jgi:glycosyltransferase involved in cell wall biosynthesis